MPMAEWALPFQRSNWIKTPNQPRRIANIYQIWKNLAFFDSSNNRTLQVRVFDLTKKTHTAQHKLNQFTFDYFQWIIICCCHRLKTRLLADEIFVESQLKARFNKLLFERREKKSNSIFTHDEYSSVDPDRVSRKLGISALECCPHLNCNSTNWLAHWLTEVIYCVHWLTTRIWLIHSVFYWCVFCFFWFLFFCFYFTEFIET